MIQGFTVWGRVQIASLSRLRDAFPHGWSVFSSLTMLNWALKGFLAWFRRLQHGRYIRLLVWWLSRRGINLRCNPCTMDATVLGLFSESKPLISSLSARSKELYTLFRWCCSQIARGGTGATRFTSMLSIWFTCRLIDLMLEVIVAAIYRKLICFLSVSEFL